MTDREMLELAAKAAGLRVWVGKWPQDDMLFAAPKRPDPTGKVTGVEWNPLTDDGDAFRLAVKVRIDIPWQPILASTTEEEERAMIRLAITRAAAEIGKEI